MSLFGSTRSLALMLAGASAKASTVAVLDQVFKPFKKGPKTYPFSSARQDDKARARHAKAQAKAANDDNFLPWAEAVKVLAPAPEPK